MEDFGVTRQCEEEEQKAKVVSRQTRRSMLRLEGSIGVPGTLLALHRETQQLAASPRSVLLCSTHTSGSTLSLESARCSAEPACEAEASDYESDVVLDDVQVDEEEESPYAPQPQHTPVAKRRRMMGATEERPRLERRVPS